MRRIILLSIIFFSFVQEGDEIASMDSLINSTEHQLASQKELRNLMEKYRAQQDVFLSSQDTKAEAEKLVSMASDILKIIEENHYESLVTPFYLQELRRFASIARRTTPSTP